jgi:hypothetical protein
MPDEEDNIERCLRFIREAQAAALEVDMQRRDTHIFDKDPRGHYVEPAWCSKRLFEEYSFIHPIWDPACGWGTITTAAKNAGYKVMGTDIVDRRRHKLGRGFFKLDFLNGDHVGSPGGKFSIVTNPPFDHIEEFARRSLDLGAQQVAMIMLVRRLNAAHWMRELPLSRVLLLTPRPSMPPASWIAAGNKPGGGTQDFCWILMSKGYRGKPEIGWLQRDRDDRAHVKSVA